MTRAGRRWAPASIRLAPQEGRNVQEILLLGAEPVGRIERPEARLRGLLRRRAPRQRRDFAGAAAARHAGHALEEARTTRLRRLRRSLPAILHGCGGIGIGS